MPGEIPLKPDALLRLFYKHPLDAFPVLDSSFSFCGLIQKRYIESASSSFQSGRVTVKDLIDRYVSQPVPGDIVRRIFGKAKIQPFPVLSSDGSLLGVWELSSFFRVFDSTPMSAHLDFRSIFDTLSVPVLITDDRDHILSFNRSFSLLSGVQQNDTGIRRRKAGRLFREIGWTVTAKKGSSGSLRLPDTAYPLEIQKIPAPGGGPLFAYVIFQLPEQKIELSSLELVPAVEAYEKRLIQAALLKCRGNISSAALELAIPRQTLQYKLGKLNISAEKFV